MTKQVKVEIDHDDLTKEVWRFYIIHSRVVLDYWSYQTRETKRHKFRARQADGTAWSRFEQRNNRCEKPIPPASVVDEALSAFRKSIKMADGETA